MNVDLMTWTCVCLFVMPLGWRLVLSWQVFPVWQTTAVHNVTADCRLYQMLPSFALWLILFTVYLSGMVALSYFTCHSYRPQTRVHTEWLFLHSNMSIMAFTVYWICYPPIYTQYIAMLHLVFCNSTSCGLCCCRFVTMHTRSQCICTTAGRLTHTADTVYQLGGRIQRSYHSTQYHELWQWGNIYCRPRPCVPQTKCVRTTENTNSLTVLYLLLAKLIQYINHSGRPENFLHPWIQCNAIFGWSQPCIHPCYHNWSCLLLPGQTSLFLH